MTSMVEWLGEPPKTKKVPHEFTRRVLHWPYCKYCGLVKLNNAASRKAAKKKCEVEI